MLTFSSDARRIVPVLSFNANSPGALPLDAPVFIRHAGTTPATKLSIVGLAPPFSLTDAAAPGSACGSSITGDCSLVLRFDPRATATTNYTKSLDRRLYKGRIQFEYFDGTITQRSGTFQLAGYALMPVQTIKFTYDPLEFAPSAVGGLTQRDTGAVLMDYGYVKGMRWLDIPQPPFHLAQDTCDPERTYLRTMRTNDSCFIHVRFRPTEPGSFRQVLHLSSGEGTDARTNSLTLQAESFQPNPEDNVLVVFNTQSLDSVALKNYYLAHRPGFSKVNVVPVSLPLNSYANIEIVPRDKYQELVLGPITQWIHAHPSKRISYLVLLHGIPTMRSWRAGNDWAWDGLQFALMQDLGALKELTPPTNYARRTLKAELPLVTHLFTGSLDGAKAYVDKLKAVHARMPKPDVILSARDTDRAGKTYYLDDSSALGSIAKMAGGFGSAVGKELTQQAPGTRIQVIPTDRPPLPLVAEDVAGFFSWGFNAGRRKNYATDRSIRFTGNSAWYIIQTAESFNGRLTDRTYQGSYDQWFSREAFGGTNFSNIPVGAVCHVEEPGLVGINNPAYFWSWENGQLFADCAWYSSNARNRLLVIGDPLVRR